MTMKTFLTTLWHDDSGQDLAEYALLLVLISVFIAAAIILLRDQIQSGFEAAANELEASL